LGELLVHQGRVAALDDTLAGPEVFDRAFGCLDLLAQAGQALAQPLVGLLARIELRFELLGDVERGDGPGDLGRNCRVFRGEADLDDPRLAQPDDA
jgi:hypothetical protein